MQLAFDNDSYNLSESTKLETWWNNNEFIKTFTYNQSDTLKLVNEITNCVFEWIELNS